MSTSPLPLRRSRWWARAVVFVATVVASISASTAVVGLDPVEVAQESEVLPATSTNPPTTTTTLAPQSIALPATAMAIPNDPCSEYHADFCVEVAPPTPSAPETIDSCRLAGEHNPTGELNVVAAAAPNAVADNALRLRIEVENGLAVESNCFAAQAMSILDDARGWSTIDDVTFVRVDGADYDFRIVLASPATTDRLCYPARTGGRYSCRSHDRVVINSMRWEIGTEEYQRDLTTYRTYLINHEVGHFLGRGHVSCPGEGEPAPVMMQQTKGLGGCTPNGWPTKDES